MSDSKKKVPKRRFEEFSNANDWEQRKLGENAVIKGRLGWKSLKQEEYIPDGPSMIAGKHIKNGEIDWEKVDHIPLWRYKESPEIMLGNGDVIFSKDGSLGNPALITNLRELATINSTMMLVRTDNTIDSGFFYQIMTSDIFKKLVYIKVSGSSIPHLFQSDMKNFQFHSPIVEEQQKLGTFFKQLDDTIALHQRKLEKIKALKTAYLSEMFPAEGESKPKRRFAGFTDDWEQRKLDNSIKVMDGDRGSNYPHDSDFFDNGDTLFLDTGNVTKNGFKFDNVKYITKEKDGQLRAGKLEKNDFVLTSRGTLGNVGFYDKFVYKRHPKLRINSAMLILRNTDEQLSCSYLHTLLKGNLISDFMRKNQVGSAQPHITKSEFLKLDLNVPCDVKEQNKIGDFFKNLDNTITLHQRKLQKLQNIKKAYLNEMFI